jgi:hypothetical protein
MSTFEADEHLQGFDDGLWFHDEASFAQLQPKCDTRRIGENPAAVEQAGSPQRVSADTAACWFQTGPFSSSGCRFFKGE